MSEEKCNHNCVGCKGMCSNKKDIDKTYRPELLPHEALIEVIKVFTDGAKKYGDFNWKRGIVYSRLYGAVQRHILNFWRGKTIDKDSGSPALAHAIAGLMMLQEMNSEWDDRECQEKEPFDFGNGTLNIVHPLMLVQDEYQQARKGSASPILFDGISATNSPVNNTCNNRAWSDEIEELEI